MGPGISREPPREEASDEVEEPMEEESLGEARELRLEEEPAEAEATEEEGAVAPEKASEGVYRLFGHELVEVAGGELSRLRCIRCGAEAPLTEAAALKERPCKTSASLCRVCGRTGITGSYCDDCARSLEDYALTARPLVRYGDRLVRVLPPDGADGWAWVGAHRTFFPYHVREGSRVWPCPACGEEYERLVDAADHFANTHPEKTGGFAREFDVKTRTDYWRSWQGYVCPRCGRMVADLSKHSCGDGR